MLLTGVYIMIIGMIVVISFLCLLILTMHGVAWSLRFLNKYFPETLPEKDRYEKVFEQHDEIAVVLAAVKAYVKG